MDYTPPPLPTVFLHSLDEKERKALEILRQLRRDKKPAILWVDESGAVRVYRAERAGILPPPA